MAATQNWAFVPALFKSCFSTGTSHIRINPHQPTPPYTHIHTFMQVLNTRYNSHLASWGGGGTGAREGSPKARRKRWG